MPMFTATRYISRAQEFCNIAAENEQDALEQIMSDENREPDDEYTIGEDDWSVEPQDETVVAIHCGKAFYCLPCMAGKRVTLEDDYYTQQMLDNLTPYPGMEICCKGCDRLLSTERKEGEEGE